MADLGKAPDKFEVVYSGHRHVLLADDPYENKVYENGEWVSKGVVHRPGKVVAMITMYERDAQKATADLFARSPEMLAVLKRIAATTIEPDEPDMSPQMLREAIKLAKNAIKGL